MEMVMITESWGYRTHLSPLFLFKGKENGQTIMIEGSDNLHILLIHVYALAKMSG